MDLTFEVSIPQKKSNEEGEKLGGKLNKSAYFFPGGKKAQINHGDKSQKRGRLLSRIGNPGGGRFFGTGFSARGGGLICSRRLVDGRKKATNRGRKVAHFPGTKVVAK